MERDDAINQLLHVRESTVLTLRIALGLWNLRRYDQHLCLNDSAAIRIEEILAWRGVKKHSRVTGTVWQSDGWQTKDVDAVREDFLLAAAFYLRGYRTLSMPRFFTTLLLRLHVPVLRKPFDVDLLVTLVANVACTLPAQ